jgi:hypothetical protein
MKTRIGPDLREIPIDDDHDEYVDDESDYCECCAMHGEDEIGGICSACGKLVD